MRQRDGQGLVQQFVAQSPIEAFDAGVLRRLAGGDGVPFDVVLPALAQDRHAGEFSAVVGDAQQWPSACGDDGVELAGDPGTGE